MISNPIVHFFPSRQPHTFVDRMLNNFTRRHKLDYEECELRYQYVPSAFRSDLLKVLFEKVAALEGGVVREYSLYRNLSVSINKKHVALFGEDDIYEGYTSDLLIDLIQSAEWHEVLSIVEQIVNDQFATRSKLNKLFAYHNVGYEIVKEEDDNTSRVEVKYDSVIAEFADTSIATERFPVIAALISAARVALADPKHIDVETSISNSMKALEGFLKEWLMERGNKVATLGEAVKFIKDKKLIDPSIAESLHHFYIFRNRTPNVGHGSASPSEINESDALLVCEMAASFINYFHRKTGS